MTGSRAPSFVHLVSIDASDVDHLTAGFLLHLASYHAEQAGDLAQVVIELRAGEDSALLIPTELYEPLLAHQRLPAAAPTWNLRTTVELAARGEGEFQLASDRFDAVLVRGSRGAELVNAGLLVFYNGRDILTPDELRRELPALVREICNGPFQTELLVSSDENTDTGTPLLLVSPERFLAHHEAALRHGDAPVSWGDAEAVLAACLPDFGIAEAAAEIELLAEIARSRRPVVIGDLTGPHAVLFEPLS
jgi:hypothetical protein